MKSGEPCGSFSILIIDDSSAMRSITSDILESFGHRVWQAENSKDGLSLFEEIYFDLVILDVNMPDMDGPKVYRELLLLNPTVNVIVYSSESQTAVSAKFAPFAVPYFLHKPVDITLLYETVNIAIKGSELLTHNNVWQDKNVLLT
ncbi:MAG: response regulator [Chloroflexota bacterium]